MVDLRTLNIRNVVSVTPTTSMLPMEEMQVAVANTVLQTLLNRGNQKACAKAALQTLGIGSLTYRNIRNGMPYEDDEDSALHRFLALRIYRVETWSLPDGQQKVFATLSETGAYRETEAAGGAVTVFKPYWLE